MSSRSPRPERAYRLKITLLGIEPAIWRRFLVPSWDPLHSVHEVIQIVMGWKDCHLHEFRINGRRYGDPAPDVDTDVLDEFGERLSKFIRRPGKTFEYLYDFGDDWWHQVELEDVVSVDEPDAHPMCLGGERACPPEDCGGVDGYAHLLEVLANPSHEEHGELRSWVDSVAEGRFEPEAFDLRQVNSILRRPRPGGLPEEVADSSFALGEIINEVLKASDLSHFPPEARDHEINGDPVMKLVEAARDQIRQTIQDPLQAPPDLRTRMARIQYSLETVRDVFEGDTRAYFERLQWAVLTVRVSFNLVG